MCLIIEDFKRKINNAMNTISKTMIFKLLIISGFFFSCAENDFQNESTRIIYSTEGSWKLIAYEDYINGQKITKDSANSLGGLDVIVTFSNSNPENYSGTNTTNHFEGKFKTSFNSKEIELVSHFTTEAFEPYWGRLFTENLDDVMKYSVTENTLILFYEDGNRGMKFEKIGS